MKLTVLFLTVFATSVLALAQTKSAIGVRDSYTGKEPTPASHVIPEELQDVGITEKLGESLDLTNLVVNENGEKVPLSTFFHKGQPVIFSPVYYNCPGLCNFHLNGVVDILKTIDWKPGEKFQVVAFSFDSKETPADASKKKELYIKMYEQPETVNGWHFITADEKTVQKITDSVGFKFKWNDKVNEWSHASAAIVLTPEGKISRYLHGIQFENRDLKLALNEAVNGKIGTVLDSAMLYCFKYNTHQSKYGLQVFRVMQLAGLVTVALLAAWLIPVMIRAKREDS